MTDDYDVMLNSSDFRAGKLVHELGSVTEDLIKIPRAELDSVFDLIIFAQFALMNLIINHQRWRAEQSRKLGINERLCQVRH